MSKEPMCGLPHTLNADVACDKRHAEIIEEDPPVSFVDGYEIVEEESPYVRELSEGRYGLTVDDPTDPGHYKYMAITPTDYITANGMDWCEGNVVKYVSRWRAKNGIEDLKKARRYIDILIEKEENV